MSFTTRDEFLALARARLLPADARPGAEANADEHSDFDLTPDLARPQPKDIRPAAVLIGLIERGEDFGVQLTLRPDTMAQHAGQVAFPGGRLDPADASLLAAALRESEEEIGLRPEQVEIIGRCSAYVTGTGYRIAPFIGLINRDFIPEPDPWEVADVFETPLSFLMNPANHERHRAVWKGREREYFAMPHNGRYIWGATAGIIRALYERLYAGAQSEAGP